MLEPLRAQNLIRVVAAAFVLSTLSFAAGVAGDLSLADERPSGERVVVRLPPEIPTDAVRAGPLPALLSTAAAEARAPAPRRERQRVQPAPKPRAERVSLEPKLDLDRAPKPEAVEFA